MLVFYHRSLELIKSNDNGEVCTFKYALTRLADKPVESRKILYFEWLCVFHKIRSELELIQQKYFSCRIVALQQ